MSGLNKEVWHRFTSVADRAAANPRVFSQGCLELFQSDKLRGLGALEVARTRPEFPVKTGLGFKRLSF